MIHFAMKQAETLKSREMKDEVEGWRLKVEDWRLNVKGWMLKVEGWRL